MSSPSYWESVGGKHGRFGTHKPWYAQQIARWESDSERPLQRRKVVVRREGPFRTKREADAFIANEGSTAAALMPPQHCECGRELPCFQHRPPGASR